jgi:hypothetical protein
MTTEQIKERISYWTRRECYKHAAIWTRILQAQRGTPVTILETGLVRIPCKNTLNSGGQ